MITKRIMLLVVLLGVLVILTPLKSDAQVTTPPALAVDPATGEVVFLIDDQVFVVRPQARRISITPQSVAFGSVNGIPAVAFAVEGSQVEVVPVAAERLTVPLDGNPYGIALRENQLYYGDIDQADFSGAYLPRAPLYTVDVAGARQEIGSVQLPEGCGGGITHVLEEAVWEDGRLRMEIVQVGSLNAIFSRYALCAGGDGIVLNPMNGGEPRSLRETGRYWVVSPDGTRIAYTTFDEIGVMDIATGDVLHTFEPAYTDYAVAWAADGNALIIAAGTRTSRFLADRLTGAEIEAFDAGITGPVTAIMTPVIEDLALTRLDLETGTTTRISEPFPNAYGVSWMQRTGDTLYVAVIPDGTAYARALTAGTRDADRELAPTIYMVDLTDGSYRAVARGWWRWTPYPEVTVSVATVAQFLPGYSLALPAQQTTCEGSTVPFGLTPGGFAYVPDDETANNIRSGAGTDNARIGTIQPGARVRVVSGPVCVDGLAWWEIALPQTGEADLVGWTAEGSDGKRWLEPGCPVVGCRQE